MNGFVFLGRLSAIQYPYGIASSLFQQWCEDTNKKNDKQVPICEHHKETPTEILCEFIYRGKTPQMCAFSTPAVTGFILCSCFYNNQLPFKIK